MVSPTEIVKGFMAEWETDGARMRAGFRRYFTPHTVYENIGMTSSVGPEAAIALVEQYEHVSGLVAWKTEILAMAEVDNKVLCERIDHLLDPEGVERSHVRVMGIFETEGDKISAWRDFFDTATWINAGGDYRPT